MAIKHRNRCNASLKLIDQLKSEIAELKKKLEEVPTDKEPSPTTSSELADKTKVRLELL